MLREYFCRLFDYDRHVNLQLSALINATNNKDKPAELMSHLLNAQQIWLDRCKATAAINYQLWPKREPHLFTDIINTNYTQWLIFLKDEVDPDQVISYQNFKGEVFSNKLTDILAHVINHGTHHRAQIGILLKQSEGIELPSTDYVHYVRGLQ